MIRKVITRDKFAVSHVEALGVPFKAVLDEAVQKISKKYWTSNGGKQYKVRRRYHLRTSD